MKNSIIKTMVLIVIMLFIGPGIVQGINYCEETWYINKEEFNIIKDDPWWDTDWYFRKSITVDHALVTDNLYDFPILVHHTSPELSENSQYDGDDFAFVTHEGVKLNHEIECYNSDLGELIAWVKLPSIDNNEDTLFYLYYGNQDCGNQENVEGTWNNHYVAVWHMNDHSSSVIKDSTIYNNDGTKSPNPSIEVDGMIGLAQDFEASNSNYIIVDDDDSLDCNADYTLEIWFKMEDLSDHHMFLYKSGDYYSPPINYYTGFHIGKYFHSKHVDSSHEARVDSGTDTVTSTSEFYYGAITSDNDGLLKNYLNGDFKDSDSESTYDICNDYDLLIGRRIGESDLFMDGILDEIRISNIPRSSEWIKASYLNQNYPNSFMDFGGQEACNHPPSPPLINGPISGKIKTSHVYTIVAEDPNEDDVFYQIDWGDGTFVEWSGPFHSNEIITRSHSWENEGTFIIKARAKDINDEIGEWGTLEVTMPKNKPTNIQYNLFDWLFEQFPNSFPVLKYLLL